MHSRLKRLRNLSLFTAIGVMSAAPTYADDTEIYTGLNNLSTALNPNVMFIIDTSGSMNVTENTALVDYDPTTTYTGTCTNTRIYWSSSGDVPTCRTSLYFEASKFRCDAAQKPLFDNTTGTGIYQDRLARYSFGFFSGPVWRPLSTFSRNPQHVECSSDEGIHGESAASAAKFIQNRAQPYTTNANNKLNWAFTGGFYTLFSANYMNYFNNTNNVQATTRIDIVKDVVKNIVDSNTNLNVSLMRFDRNANGGPIIFPFSDIDSGTVRTDFKNTVEALNARGLTPLSETMSEALRVYTGQPAVFGLSPPANPETTSVTGAFSSGTTYDSPMDVQCQKNFIIFLSDGLPVGDTGAVSFTNSLISGQSFPSGDVSCGGNDNCLDELAEYMNVVDLVPGLAGQQSVVTYTIGFGSDAAGSADLNALLKQTGEKGGGDAFIAQDFRQLSSVFTQIITEIQSVNTTFTAPAVSVNAFNRLTNREELFFTLFKPEVEPIWTGNLKRFRLGQKLDGNGDPVDSDNDGTPDRAAILDVNGNLAVSDQTGFFDTNAVSFWTTNADSPDGDETAKGGAARLFGGGDVDPAQARTIYTNFGATNDLTAASNAVAVANGNLTGALIGLTGASGEPTRDELMRWLTGVDTKDEDGDGSSTDARRVMGDPLHTKPLILEYAPAPSEGNRNPDSDVTVYMATNEGIMHAIDSDTGAEIFSFIPKQQLARASTYFMNAATGFKDYGLDGPIASYFDDANGDGFLDPTQDTYIIVIGERRGGRNYYALDVTDRSNPVFKWQIVGGTGDFYELGQSWSLPLARKIKLNGVEKDVFVFAGGYDTTQDTEDTVRLGDTSGRAVYMVDVLTGELVWWAGKTGITGPAAGDPTPNLALSEMDYSMPSDLTALDLNGDGFLDRIYVPNMGGQLFRIDFDNEGNSGAGSLATGHLFADLQKSAPTDEPTAANNRRFYFPPDVAFFSDGVDEPFLSLAFGSGYRAHPLNTTVQDRFYLLQDKNPFSTPATYPATLDEGDLKDVTNDLSPNLTGFNGWFITLVNSTGTNIGEKVLATATTIAGTVLFTTFSPVAGASANSCAPNQGVGTVFGVSAIDASATDLFDTVPGGSGSSDPRVVTVLTRTGIPPEVTILFPPSDPGSPVGLVAAEPLKLTYPNNPVETYWYEQETQ